MIRASLPPAVPRRPLRAGGGPSVGAAAVLSAWPLAARAAPGGDTPAATVVALLALVLVFVLAFVLMAWGLRAQRRATAQAEALQRSRAEWHALRGALDAWHWRTDAQHRLVEWRAPSSVTGPALRTGTRLWEVLASEASPLQARLESQAALTGLPVSLVPGASTAPAAFVLHAQPVLDAAGQFAGHVGTARPLHDGVTSLLTQVLMGLDNPVLRVAPGDRGPAPRLVQHNPAAAAWLSLGDAPTWADVVQALPAGLAAPLGAVLASPDGTRVEGPAGWSVRMHCIPCGPADGGRDERLVIFHQAGAPALSATTPPADGDAESFSYTVSHDLRAPIRVVEGFTRIVKEDYGNHLDRVGNDHLDRVLAAAARMNSMIDALLALSQLSTRPLSRQPVNLSMLAGYILDDLRRQSPEREVEVHIEDGLQCHGDATLLRVVLENLLGNAWKYTGKCRVGRIWVERSEHEGRPAFTVRDNGAGFDMRFADRLFGVFQRLHSANDFQGTGIGLASVRRIVRRHGGDIWAEAEVDRGARFQFWVK